MQPEGASRSSVSVSAPTQPVPLSACRVVLVRPQNPGNVGATARVMRNFGLTDLVLVAPEADPTDPQARRLSTHGEEILNRARRVSSLEEAVADCVQVAGTTARTGGPFRRGSVGLPREVLPRLVSALASGPAALVFGPERTGLTNAEVMRCHHLVHIPTDPTYPALNLGQAVGICLAELRQAWLEQGPHPASPPLADFASQEHMFANLRAALEEIHFLYDPHADTLMHALRQLIVRAGPTAMEVDILHGLARQLRWYVRQHGLSESSGGASGPADEQE